MWKVGNGWTEKFAPAERDGVSPPVVVVSFLLPDDEPAALKAEAEADSDGLLVAFVSQWKATSARWAEYQRLRAEQARTADRQAEATAKAASLQSALDETLFDGRPADSLDAKLEKAALELRAVKFRSERLAVLVPQSKESCKAELRLQLEDERQRQADRLTAEVNHAAADLAAAAETYAGQWYIKSEALRRVAHAHDKDRVLFDAMTE